MNGLERIVIFILVINFTQNLAKAEEILTLPQAIRSALLHRTEIRQAQLEYDKARIGFDAIESQLGWQATTSLGMQHSIDFLGQPTDQQQLTGVLQRTLSTGQQIEFQGLYQKDDSQQLSSSFFPNPSETYSLKLNYRMPIMKGKGNEGYVFASAQARTSTTIAEANTQLIIEQKIEQVIQLYHQLLDLQIQREENQRAIERSKKLKQYIFRNLRLGIAEERDRLSIEARLASQIAEQTRLQREWQSSALRLQQETGVPVTTLQIQPYKGNAYGQLENLDIILDKVKQRDFIIKINMEKIALSESQLQLNRDTQKDRFDVVLSVGNETRQGDTVSGHLDENEWVGGVHLEYQLPFDRRGVDAGVKQALIEIDRVRLENKRYTDDLAYQIRQWHEEWLATDHTIRSYRYRRQLEISKKEEVEQRYREGRTDIREVLDAEEALTIAERLLAKEIARRSQTGAFIENRLGIFARLALQDGTP